MKYYGSSTRFVYEFLPPEIGQITNSNPIPLDSPIIGFLRVSPKMKQRREKKRGKPIWKVHNRVRPVIYLHLGCCFGLKRKSNSDDLLHDLARGGVKLKISFHGFQRVCLKKRTMEVFDHRADTQVLLQILWLLHRLLALWNAVRFEGACFPVLFYLVLIAL